MISLNVQIQTYVTFDSLTITRHLAILSGLSRADVS
jgi:hypothetical protein